MLTLANSYEWACNSYNGWKDQTSEAEVLVVLILLRAPKKAGVGSEYNAPGWKTKPWDATGTQQLQTCT